MAYNKAREEKKWKIRKEVEEKQMRKLGVKEDIIRELRIHDWNDFKADRLFYHRLAEMGTYIDHLLDEERENEVYTIDDLLDSIENERLFAVLCQVDKRTLQILLMKIQGFSTRDIARFLEMSEKAVYRKMDRFKEKMKKI